MSLFKRKKEGGALKYYFRARPTGIHFDGPIKVLEQEGTITIVLIDQKGQEKELICPERFIGYSDNRGDHYFAHFFLPSGQPEATMEICGYGKSDPFYQYLRKVTDQAEMSRIMAGYVAAQGIVEEEVVMAEEIDLAVFNAVAPIEIPHQTYLVESTYGGDAGNILFFRRELPISDGTLTVNLCLDQPEVTYFARFNRAGQPVEFSDIGELESVQIALQKASDQLNDDYLHLIDSLNQPMADLPIPVKCDNYIINMYPVLYLPSSLPDYHFALLSCDHLINEQMRCLTMKAFHKARFRTCADPGAQEQLGKVFNELLQDINPHDLPVPPMIARLVNALDW